MKAVMSLDGPVDVTESHASTDSSQTLISILTGLDAGRSIQGALITNETNDVRFAFGVDPTQAGLGHILAAGQSIMLRGGQAVKNFRFISKTAATHGTLAVTVYYEA